MKRKLYMVCMMSLIFSTLTGCAQNSNTSENTVQTKTAEGENMPKNISEFYNAWEGNAMNQDALGCDGENTKLDADGRRIVLFAPNDYPWCDMEVNLSHVIRKDIEAGQGGSELEMNEVYTLIAYSM